MNNIKLYEDFIKEHLNEGTGNFYKTNATHYFAIGEGDDGDEAHYEDSKANILSELKGKGYVEAPERQQLQQDNRSFPGAALANKEVDKKFGDNTCTITLTAVIRSGYYQGANLDWEISYNYGGESVEALDEDDVKNEFTYNAEDEEKAKLEKEAEKAYKWMEAEASKLTTELEDIYEENTMALAVTARFSSGETHYGKVGKKASNRERLIAAARKVESATAQNEAKPVEIDGAEFVDGPEMTKMGISREDIGWTIKAVERIAKEVGDKGTCVLSDGGLVANGKRIVVSWCQGNLGPEQAYLEIEKYLAPKYPKIKFVVKYGTMD